MDNDCRSDRSARGTCSSAIGGEPVNLDEFRQQLEQETSRLNALQRSLEAQESQLNADRRLLQEQRQRIDALYQRMTGRGPAPGLASPGAEPPIAVAPAANQPERVRSAQTDTSCRSPGGSRARKHRWWRRSARITGVLTPQGKLVLEPSLSYLHGTNNRAALLGFTIIPAITIGLIDIRRISRDTFTGAHRTLRSDESLGDLRRGDRDVHATSSTITRPLATPAVTDSLFEGSGNGIGDTELAARFQINQGGAEKPFYVGSLRVRLPTGKSPYARHPSHNRPVQ